MIGKVRITSSKEDGIFLHFEPIKGGVTAGITLEKIKSGSIIATTIQNWADEAMETKDLYSVECPDKSPKWEVVYGDPIRGRLMCAFHSAEEAEEMVDMWNTGRVVRNTMVAYHPEMCCGCSIFYFSHIHQDMVQVCNECGSWKLLCINS